jgi:hypothetical protein
VEESGPSVWRRRTEKGLKCKKYRPRAVATREVEGV